MLSDKGFNYQQKGIDYYKKQDFSNSEKYLLLALKNNFCSPGGLTYLAKIYRKRKDYVSEIQIIDDGISIMQKSKEFGTDFKLLKNRQVKAKTLLNSSQK